MTPLNNSDKSKKGGSRLLKVLFATLAISATILPSSISQANPTHVDVSAPAKFGASLQSKYAYFKSHNTIVINAILLTRCNPPKFSYEIVDGAEIWVRQTKSYYTGTGFSNYARPMIAYRKATSASGKFALVAAGESKLWWKTKWGCPINGTWNTYGTKVTMSTQELINAGY